MPFGFKSKGGKGGKAKGASAASQSAYEDGRDLSEAVLVGECFKDMVIGSDYRADGAAAAPAAAAPTYATPAEYDSMYEAAEYGEYEAVGGYMDVEGVPADDYDVPVELLGESGRYYSVVDPGTDNLVGKDCRVLGYPCLGTIRHAGMVDGLYRYGVELDLACGRNNGSVQGTRYFRCKDNHGIFVIREKLQLLAGTKGDRVPPMSAIPGFAIADAQRNIRVWVCTPAVEGRGYLQFVGESAEADDCPLAGVILDHPKGSCDGRSGTYRYFSCKAGHGIFVQPWQLARLDVDSGRPQVPCERRRCAYMNRRAARCPMVAGADALLCQNHACGTAGCLRGKASKDRVCVECQGTDDDL